MTNFFQLSTKLQDFFKKVAKVPQLKAAHATEYDALYCMKANMVKSSSWLYCRHSPIYYHKGRLVQHYHYLVHVVNLANAIRIKVSQIYFFAIDCTITKISKAVCKAAGSMHN